MNKFLNGAQNIKRERNSDLESTNRYSRMTQHAIKETMNKAHHTIENLVKDISLLPSDIVFVMETMHYYDIGIVGEIDLDNGLKAKSRPIIADGVGDTGMEDIIGKTDVATKSSVGVVQIGDNLSITKDGVVDIPLATSLVAGVIKVGQGLIVDENGSLTLNPEEMPDISYATSETAGVIKVGLGLDINDDGVLSVNIPISEIVNKVIQVPAYQTEIDLGALGVTDIIEPMIFFGSTKLINRVDYTLDPVRLRISLHETYSFATTLDYIDYVPFVAKDIDFATTERAGIVVVGDGLEVAEDGTLSALTFDKVRYLCSIDTDVTSLVIPNYPEKTLMYDPFIFSNNFKLIEGKDYELDQANKTVIFLNERTSVVDIEFIDYPPMIKRSYINANTLDGKFASEFAKSSVTIEAKDGLMITGNKSLRDNITISLDKSLLDDFGNIKIYGKTYEEFLWQLKEDILPILRNKANTVQCEYHNVVAGQTSVTYLSNFSHTLMVVLNGVMMYPSEYTVNIPRKMVIFNQPAPAEGKIMISNISYAI
ncbi:MAG: hypothetical protein ACRC92_24100 [Peptostreptococcaceae bacterium]